uniref:Uncharacterized protein n=1 Tax=Arundo donax TaxID=35708 RepID=A0A0A9AIR8_ARUDO
MRKVQILHGGILYTHMNLYTHTSLPIEAYTCRCPRCRDSPSKT